MRISLTKKKKYLKDNNNDDNDNNNNDYDIAGKPQSFVSELRIC